MRESSFGSARTGWLRVWSTFAGLLLLTTLIAYWLWQPAGPEAPRASMAGMTLAAPAGSTSTSASVVPAGFMRAPSGHLLPRFVSLTRANAAVRTGPGDDYPVAWVIRLAGIPLEVLAEAGDYWRVRDAEGSEGWIHRHALADERTALVSPWNPESRHPLRTRPDDAAPLRAWLTSGVLARVTTCDGRWCAITVTGARGWVRQEQLWGIYAGESIAPAR